MNIRDLFSRASPARRELANHGVPVCLVQKGKNVRITGSTGNFCLLNQTVEAIAAHLQTSSDALFAAFSDHAAQNQCHPAEALLRGLSTRVALVYIHQFNAWNNEPRKRPTSYSLDIAWPVLERWGGTQEIVRFARTHAGTEWQAFAQCVGRLTPQELANVVQRMQEFDQGW